MGFDIREVSETLKISSEYIVSIENDMFDRLPVAVYTVGYIRCYAKYLEVDPGPVISSFTSHLVSPKPSTIIPVASSRRKVPVYVYAVLLILTGLLIFAVYEYTWKDGPNLALGPAVEKAGPSVKGEDIIPAVPPALNVAPVKKPEDWNPAEKHINESAQAAVVEGEHQLEITASDTVWLRISFENGKQEEMLLRSGESKSWKFGGKAVLRIGNAGGISLKFDGKDLGIPHDPGKVLDLTLPQS